MNILITGCNGQLGNEIQLLEKDHSTHQFINTDINELDICDQEAVDKFVSEHEVDGIVNCAAYTAVDRAENDKEQCTTLNTIAPAYLANAVEQRGGWIIHISTDYVFNGKHFLPYKEDDTPSPDSVYGSTKLAAELTYARDLARAIMAIIEKGIEPGVYHFSNEGVISWYDFAKAIHRLAGITDCKVRPLHTEEYPTPAHRPPYSVLDKTKIKQTFGIEIPYWEESLADCIKLLQQA